MKKLLLLIVIVILFPSISLAHPGRTASDGCHYCRTNCSSWGVAWNQRHCHGGYTKPATTTPKTTSTSTYTKPKTSYNSKPTTSQLNNTSTKSITSSGTSSKVQNTKSTTITSPTKTTTKSLTTATNYNNQKKESADDSSAGVWVIVAGAGGYLYWRHKKK